MVEKIRVRLEKRERIQIIKRYSFLSVLALTFVFSMLMTFPSTVRADVLQTIKQSPVVEFLCNLKFSATCGGDGILTINPSEILSLEDAQARFASPIVLPTYVPQGFNRRADVELFDLTDQPTLVITWDGKNRARSIKLLISHHSMELEKYARTLGKGAFKETMLNGKLAVIVRGTWNIGIRENDLVMTAVMWKYDENTVYSLLSLEQAIWLDELIKVAESIP